MVSLLIFFILAYIFITLPQYIRYRNSKYRIVSRNSFYKTVFDKGTYGEFLIFSYLEKLEGHNKLLSNLYLPKEDGTTTEVDLIMICETGIYVFESKNYSGWIFGDEKYKKWTQSLKNKQKNYFFNPIWQNKTHITALKNLTGISDDNVFKSYIIFSERCTLKNVNVTSENVKVIKRDILSRMIKNQINESSKIFTAEEIDKLYCKLFSYICVDEKIKIDHIESIREKKVKTPRQ